MALCECIDCRKKLSPTATTCNGCNSTDPFGQRRAEEKARLILVLIGIAGAGLVWLAFHFGILTFEMIKNFLHLLAK